ncbi:hypothetical protein M501DRAFT_1027339 [Patellaria atrata CBS 101060]|uniref:3-carboxymuconate cyclase n=1 Tax=Patellaria atrata CBS 101060 TaxID=1346257 RepID=A0A9P4VKD4_9PEZI|nr:hypothetical protein M501DRAFT_1027339 [Patellaria atrata CBS 101060]
MRLRGRLKLRFQSTPLRRHQQTNKNVGTAIYLITNDVQNAVVALPIGRDGTLSQGTITPTGGAGSVALNAMNQPATPDALVSQSALAIAGRNIFAVNAGSNTLTMMRISRRDPTRLMMVGQPVAIPGEFPNTVAASKKNGLVCVATTGAVAGVSCASFSRSGLSKMDSLRPFDIGQSTPPVGPTNTVSHTFFSADESTLFTTVKGDPAVNNTGFLSAFPVASASRGCGAMVSMQETRSSPDGTAVLFGSSVIPGTSNLFTTDASFGAAILSVADGQSQASLIASQAIDGQKATCWATVSDATSSAFVTDVGTNRIVEMSIEDASIIDIVDLTENGDPGLIDLRVAGNFVYALSPGDGTTQAAVTVLDVSRGQGTGKMAQHFQLGFLTVGKNAMGMVALV